MREISSVDLEDLASEILGQGQALRFRARGNSMIPFIQGQDVLTVLPDLSVRRGDVVLCRLRRPDGKGMRVLAHRVVGVRCIQGERALLLRGDALGTADGWVPEGDVLGRVHACERGGRRIVLDAGPHRLLGLGWVVLAPAWRRLLRVWRRMGR